MVQIHTLGILWIGSDDMSNKPVKKSDSEKDWMKKRRDNRRMIAPEYHLIVTEGTKTEPKYFGKLKEEINSKYTGRISIEIAGIGSTPELTEYIDWYKNKRIKLKLDGLSPVEYRHKAA